MSNSANNTLNKNQFSAISFRGYGNESKIPIITKPIEKVENIVNNTVDVFVPETQDEEKKKSNKKVIRVGSTVLVLSTIVLLLNPKFSSGLIQRLKTKSAKAGNKAKVDNSITGLWNKIKEKFYLGYSGIIQAINNANSTKDELFKKLCEKTKLTKDAHNWISKSFDKISQRTVFAKYASVNKKMNTLENIVNHYKTRLSDADKIVLEKKLAEIKKIQEYFSKQKIQTRLIEQENQMNNLEKDVFDRLKNYKDIILKNEKNKKDIFNFWAEEAVMPQRTKLEQEGEQVVESLMGNEGRSKGAYNEIIDILAPHLKSEEKSALEESIHQIGKRIKKANKSECIEYFDKKRDLLLGSAPTDVVTAFLSLIASGIAIGVADSKEDRVSRTITGVIPVIGGLGVSTALTAMLFSGGKGMILGTASSMILSGIGNFVNRIFFPHNINKTTANDTDKNNLKEVKNA